MQVTPFYGLLLPFPWLVCFSLPLAVLDTSSTFVIPALEPGAQCQRMPSGEVSSLAPGEETSVFHVISHIRIIMT